MSYQSEVLADSPYLYFPFDETSGTTLDNLGSLGTDATITGSLVVNEPPAANIPGKSVRTTHNTQSYASLSGVVLPNEFTIEFWFKRENTFTGTNDLVELFVSGSTIFKIVTDNTGFFNMVNPDIGDFSSSGISDGNWHHIVLTASESTSTSKLYIDGTLVQTSSWSTLSNTSGTFYIGDRSAGTGNRQHWLDELALYPSVLSGTRIAAHYTAATASVTNINVVPPAITVSTTNPAPVPGTGRTISVTPATTSVAAPAPTLDIYNQYTPTLIATADGQLYDANNTSSPISLSTGGLDDQTSFFVKFDDPRFTDTRFVSATLKLRLPNNTGSSTGYKMRRVTSAWTEASSSKPSAVDISGATGTIPAAPGGEGSREISIDLAGAVTAWNSGSAYHGVEMKLTSGGPSVIYTREAAAGLQPTLEVVLEDIPTTDSENIVVGTLYADVAMPDAAVKTGLKISVTPATVSVTAPAPVVSGGFNAIISTPPMLVDSTFPGGIENSPDQYEYATPMEVTALMPVPNVTGGNDLAVQTDAATVSVEMPDVTFSNFTEVQVPALPAEVTVQFPGGIRYVREDDRYLNYVPSTIDEDDVWYQMEETSGTVANDASVHEDDVAYKNDGTYVGGPVFEVIGPQFRKAVSFDGLDDHLFIPGYRTGSLFTEMDTTIEFSIRTSDLNGTLVAGLARDSVVKGGRIKLVDGYITLISEFDVTWTVRKFVADGEWHHIVISNPSLSGYLGETITSLNKPTFVSIDGIIQFQRYNIPLSARRLVPYAALAYRDARNPSVPATDFVEAEMRDFIVRLNYAVSRDTASKLYYEWSNSLIINPEPMEASAEAVAPEGAGGNVKKMLAVYGLPWERNFSTNVAELVYQSTFANFRIEQAGDVLSNDSGPGPSYYPVEPFYLHGYLVYPVSIVGNKDSTDPYSAQGLVNGEYIDPETGNFTDDLTGLLRFIDFDLDLVSDVTEFDALTVVNYPAVRPRDGFGYNDSDLYQDNLGLSDGEWTRIRDDFRDMILNAMVRGVNLWCTEPQMAEHLGIISGYEIHGQGRYQQGNVPMSPAASNLFGKNLRADELDDEHVVDTFVVGLDGDYSGIWQANSFRRIVATEPDLTDIPSFEESNRIVRFKYDRFGAYADVVAYDVVDKTDGLAVNDLVTMSAHDDYYGSGIDGVARVGNPRWAVVSAVPDGVVGKVIAREMEVYYGANGVAIPNPYSENVITVALERGTVLRGRPIGGRAFVEFMDTDTTTTEIAIDKYPDMWNGVRDVYKTTWSVDTRRNRDFVSSSSEWAPVYEYLPTISMNGRGLLWLQAAEEIPEGDAKVYVPAFIADAEMADVQHSQDRSSENTVPAMRAYVELQQPANYQGPDVEVSAQPMDVSVTWGGLKRTSRTGAMTAAASMPSVTVTAGGDRVTVYVDDIQYVTLYLREE